MINTILLSCILIVLSFNLIMVSKSKPVKIPQLPMPKEPKMVTYDEEQILKHLDYIVQEAIDQYVLYNIIPRDVAFINSQIESTMISELQDDIPNRISPTLLDQLSLIYNPDYIGRYIGGYLYMKVTDYVVSFNNNPNT